MSKILVSMLAYREKDLESAVKSLWENAKNPENLIFSIVSEQSKPELHPSLDFIPADQLHYFKYDLSEYRGVMWSRWKTASVDVDYDYFFQTCGHNIFVKDWDDISIKEFNKAKIFAGHEKVILTVSGSEYGIGENGEYLIENVPSGRVKNTYHRTINNDYIPGHGFPYIDNFPDDLMLVPAIYWQGSYIFTTKNYLSEVPFDPNISYHTEEIHLTIQAWCAGWRFWATPKTIYHHLTIKKYPGEELHRSYTHRPWADLNKKAFWEQSDASLIILDKLFAGEMSHIYKNANIKNILEYCDVSGLDKKWTNHYLINNKDNYIRHGFKIRHEDPVLLD